jgi:nucleoside-diphosphate-sugar epimerase
MPALIDPEGTVLVTGANGYVAYWIIGILLKRGVNVRAAVRTTDKGQHLLDIFQPYHDKLKLIAVGDIAKPGAFDEAVLGVSGIIHTVSPVCQALGDPNEMILPAVNGVRSILDSVLEPDSDLLKCVIITSSCATISHASPDKLITVDESEWNDAAVQACEEFGSSADGILKYVSSKVLAKRLAWDWYTEHKHEVKWDLCALIPPWVRHHGCEPFLSPTA